MTINADPYDYLVLNIINSDNWRYRPISESKIMKTLPVNDDLRYAICFLYPENGRSPCISFKLKEFTFYLNKKSEAYGQYSYYLTQEKP